jgi:hypothetical protein
MDHSSGSWERQHYGLSILSITVLGALYRLWGIDTIPMYFDELAVWINVLAGDAATAEGASLRLLLSWVTTAWGEADALSWRPVLAVISSLAIPVVGNLARRLAGPEAGILAAVLLAASPLAWHYAPQIRPYGIYLLFTALLYDGFVAAHERDWWRDWAQYGAALCVCCMTHLVTALIAVPLGVVSLASLATSRDSGRFLRFLVVSIVASGLGILWWVMRTPGATMSVLSGRYPDGVLLFLQEALLTLGPKVLYPRGVSLSALPALVLFGLAVVGCGVCRRSHPAASGLFGLSFVFTLGVQFYTLGEKAEWSWARYIVHLLPFYLVLIAVAVGWFAGRIAHTLRDRGPTWMPSGRPTAHVALGLVSVLMFMPGWTSQNRAQMELSSGAVYPNLSDLVWQRQNELQGVVVLPYAMGSSVDARSLAGFYVHKRDTLPTFTVKRQTLHEVNLDEAVFAFQDMPRLGPPLEAMPPDGTYALLGGDPLERCSQLTSAHVAGLIESRDTGENPGVICKLTFKGGNLSSVRVDVGNVARITGYRVNDAYYSPGDPIELAVRWLPVATTWAEHRVVVELRDSEGTPIATGDVGLDAGDTNAMHPVVGRPFLETYTVQIPDTAAPTAEASIVVGLVRRQLGVRLPVGGGDTDTGRLGTVRISAAGCGPREDTRPASQRTTDAALSGTILELITQDAMVGSLPIETSVYQSVVTFCSDDTSAEERARVMQLVEPIEGIERIDDRMR